MNQMITLGPLALPVAFLVAVGALWAGWSVASRVARTRSLDVEPQLWLLLVVGLVAARLAFVVQYGSAYAEAPLSVIDVRDGGMRPLVGVLAAVATLAVLAAWRRALGKPLALGTATAVVVWVAASAGLSLREDRSAGLPDLTLPALDGAPVTLREFRGKPVVLNLWATWCPPCVREMPVLAQAQQGRPDVHVLFVNQGEAADRVRGFLAARGLALRNVVLDASGQVAVQLGHRALPATLFFDAEGRLVDTRVGELSTATLTERLAAIAPAPSQRLP